MPPPTLVNLKVNLSQHLYYLELHELLWPLHYCLHGSVQSSIPCDSLWHSDMLTMHLMLLHEQHAQIRP